MIWAASGRCLSVLFVYLLHGQLARHLSPDDYGVYVLVESVVLLLSIVILAGVPNVSLRMIRGMLVTGNSEGAAQTVRAAIGIVFLSVVLISVTASSIAYCADNHLLRGRLLPFVPFVVFAAGGTALLRLLSELGRGYEMLGFSYFVGGMNGGFGVNAGILVSVLAVSTMFGLNLPGVMWVLCGVQFLVLGPALAVVLRASHQSDFRSAFSGSAATEVLQRSIPLLIHQMIMFGLPETDTLLLATFSTPRELALYGAARKITYITIVPLLLVSHAMQPFISEFHAQKDKRRMTLIVRGLSSLSGIPSIVLICLIAAVPEFLLQVFFGPEFAAAARPMQILALGATAYVLTGPCGLVLTNTGHERAAMASSITAAVGYVLIAPHMVREFGTLGAAGCAASLQIFTNLSAMALVSHFEKISTGISCSPRLIFDCISLVFPRILKTRNPQCSEKDAEATVRREQFPGRDSGCYGPGSHSEIQQ